MALSVSTDPCAPATNAPGVRNRVRLVRGLLREAGLARIGAKPASASETSMNTPHDDSDHVPNPVDRHVGLRIRMRRKELGFSQERLAEAIGLTFQQVQKYERAANRVSASKLWEIARVLSTSTSFFYAGLDAAETSTSNLARDTIQDFLMTPDGMELAASFPKLPRQVRHKVLELVRAMAVEPGVVEA
jgi:transcriptional regulator with XRE-family HTH domain